MKTAPQQLGDLYHYIIKVFKQHSLSTPDLDARRVIEARTPFVWSDIIASPQAHVSQDSLELISQDLTRRIAGEPLSRIYGVREFWGRVFEISPHTLDPRPDTEILVEAVIEEYKDRPAPTHILDLGTGSGCILVTLLSAFRSAQGVGVDISADALDMSMRNARTHGVERRAQFYQGSWFEALNEPAAAQEFDLVVSNPPYIARPVIANLGAEVRDFDPILALDGGENGLDAYKKIFSGLFSMLSSDGKSFFEIGYDQEKSVVRLAEESRFIVERIYSDLAGHPRVVEISRGDK